MDPTLAIVLGAVALATLALALLIRGIAQLVSPVGLTSVDLRSARFRLFAPAIRLFEPLVGWTVTPAAARRIGHRLALAGLQRELTAVGFRSIQCFCGLLAVGATMGLGWALSAPPSPLIVLAAACAALLWPNQWLRRQTRQRLDRIRRQLPFLIELVAMSIESGLPLSAALPQAVERSPSGPLREEFLRALGDVKTGRSREEALTALGERVAQPALTQFILALLAIHRDGGSVLHLLKTIAEQQRSDRLIRAEHLAMQAPVKLLLPLVVFIFPGTFAILLYPVIVRVIAQGGLW